MTCQYQSRERDRGRFTCALGYYAGKPWLGNCNKCIAAGENTPEAAEQQPHVSADSEEDKAAAEFVLQYSSKPAGCKSGCGGGKASKKVIARVRRRTQTQKQSANT